MVEDPGLQVAERLAIGHLRGKLDAELRLASRPLEEDDHPLGHGQGHATAEVLLHQRQHEIQARRGAGRCIDPAVPNVDGIRLHPDARKAPRQLVAKGPVRRRTAALQEPRLGQDERSRTEPDQPPGPRSHARQPAHELRVAPRVVGPVDPGDDQRVDGTTDGAVRPVGDEPQPWPGTDRLNRRHHLDGVARVGRAGMAGLLVDGIEDVEDAAHLDDLVAGHRDHYHPPHSHRRLLSPGHSPGPPYRTSDPCQQ